MVRAATRGLLQILGHSVDVVANGREAVDAASRRRFDVVFLDVEMPGMDGPETAARLREQHGNACPWIVGLSGDDEGSEHFAAFGMDDFLPKPARTHDFHRVLARLRCESLA